MVIVRIGSVKSERMTPSASYSSLRLWEIPSLCIACDLPRFPLLHWPIKISWGVRGADVSNHLARMSQGITCSRQRLEAVCHSEKKDDSNTAAGRTNLCRCRRKDILTVGKTRLLAAEELNIFPHRHFCVTDLMTLCAVKL
jgi:hypothetical protein